MENDFAFVGQYQGVGNDVLRYRRHATASSLQKLIIAENAQPREASRVASSALCSDRAPRNPFFTTGQRESRAPDSDAVRFAFVRKFQKRDAACAAAIQASASVIAPCVRRQTFLHPRPERIARPRFGRRSFRLRAGIPETRRGARRNG
jgi:hypothetical protein